MLVKRLLGSPRPLVAVLSVLAAYVMLVLSGLVGSVVLFAVAGLAVLAVELQTRRVESAPGMLRRIGITAYHRHIARDAGVLLLLATADLGTAPVVVATSLLAVGWIGSVASAASAALIRRTVVPPVETRNLDLTGLDLPAPPPGRALALAGERSLYANALLVPAAIVAVVTEAPVTVAVAGVVAAVAVVAVAAMLLPAALRAFRAPSREAMLAAIRSRLTPDPRVMLHFAGSGKDAYQVNMWLRTVEQLDEPAVVLLRERSCLAALAPTSLPVVCIPGAVETMNFGWDSVRVALHPANVGKNIHILREPGMKHVFVGHGDSDKAASINPYSKVYDEVWVAGRAGRDRYLQADVGVRDEDIVEVGRPQLGGVLTTGSAPDGPFTVLYAPTWEGWIDDPHATSLLLLGERIIRTLLSLSPSVRVWYKPHPLTGTRSKEAGAVSERIAALVGGSAASGTQDLRAIGNQVFTGPTPALYDCFNHSDMLISDVSSVVSDWIASGKPYAVGNTRDLPEDELRRQYPTTSAAYLISADGSNLEKIVQLARTADDPMAADRRSLKEYLLGPDDPPSMVRLQAEVCRLAALADARAAGSSLVV